ncbi:hypothetical protein APB26_34350 [Pseudomonas aeruginosa]|uniref:hypothetical protein n=1 Tax=Pseudomonas aeruginosa TaxID=287 RepID=UPI0008FAFEE9|nr:hypothetical protein [Pseudomonas aeruginosa]OPE29616.1 hypothetical protein APB26_34350 [Pseudomonas aeruginosa]RPV61427.1 hypothetical protein IPC838_19100 [Pseudomonas aeruginosa]
MSFIPSCDNSADALNSLANIYGVSHDAIREILLHPTVLEIAGEYGGMDSPWFPIVISQLLRSNPRYELDHAAYYHTTSYDGSSEWFEEGLLGSLAGAQRFLEKIAHLVPSHQRNAVGQMVSHLLATRSGCEGTTSSAAGPYAWNTFAAASGVGKGLNYQVPEIIQDIWGQSGLGKVSLIDLSDDICQNLRPVVVKFKGKTSDLDTYSATLWAYLLTLDDSKHLSHTFHATGESVPKFDILELIEL